MPDADRYARQTILPGFGVEAAQRLAAAHVMVIGAGALGCPALDLLARAGIGRLSIVDRDLVELTNLQRQMLYTEADIAKPKAEVAAARLRAANRAIRIDALVEDFTPDTAEPLLLAHPRPQIILDCTDNFQTRYLINDACIKHNIPLVYGGAVGTTGCQLTILPGQSPCLRCIFPDAPAPGTTPTCDTAGIFAPVSAMIGAAQAADAIKLIVDPSRLSHTMLSFDLWANSRSRLALASARDPSCPCCAERRFEHLSARSSQRDGCSVLCGRNAVQVTPPATTARHASIDLAALHQRLAPHGQFELTPSMLSGHLHDPPAPAPPRPLTIFADGRAIVGHTTDPIEARSIYARFIGA